MPNPEKAKVIFNSGLNCAQAILLTFTERYHLDKELAVKITCGFGGGMAGMQESCGAFTGSIMVIGLAKTNKELDNPTNKEIVYHYISEFTKRFKEKYPSTLCREILNCNLNSEEGYKTYEDMNLRDTVCAECVACSVTLLDELLK
mgnify:CR=1 FL=1